MAQRRVKGSQRGTAGEVGMVYETSVVAPHPNSGVLRHQMTVQLQVVRSHEFFIWRRLGPEFIIVMDDKKCTVGFGILYWLQWFYKMA